LFIQFSFLAKDI